MMSAKFTCIGSPSATPIGVTDHQPRKRYAIAAASRPAGATPLHVHRPPPRGATFPHTDLRPYAKSPIQMTCESEANLPGEQAVQIAVEEGGHDQPERVEAIDSDRHDQNGARQHEQR